MADTMYTRPMMHARHAVRAQLGDIIATLKRVDDQIAGQMKSTVETPDSSLALQPQDTVGYADKLMRVSDQILGCVAALNESVEGYKPS